jgi:hypothetical protein
MLVTTEGSGFATVLTVYSGPPNAISIAQLTDLTQVANTGYDHLTSRLACPAASNQTYYAAVEGAKGASGHVTISWEIPYQQAIEPPATNQPAGSAVLAIQTTNSPPASVQWLFDQVPLAGATNLTLALNNITTAGQGFYSVNLTGSNGAVTHDLVYLQVLPLLLDAHYVESNNTVQIHFGTTYGKAVHIQSSSNLLDWVPVYTNNAPGTNNFFTNALSPGQSARYYQFYFP